MITGAVNAYDEPIIRCIVRGPLGQEQEVEAVVDTGFTGSLSLPLAIIVALGLPFRRRSRAVLADGSSIRFDVYEGLVLWDGRPRVVPISAAEAAPLIGMGLLRGYELTMQVVVGGSVTISPIP
jgi:clan AA aspartic protease